MIRTVLLLLGLGVPAACPVLAPASLAGQDLRVLPFPTPDTTASVPAEGQSSEEAAALKEFRILVDFSAGDLNHRLDTLSSEADSAPGFTSWRSTVTPDGVVRLRVRAEGLAAGRAGDASRTCEIVRGLVALLEIGSLRSGVKEAFRGFAVGVYGPRSSPEEEPPDDLDVPEQGLRSSRNGGERLLARTARDRTVVCGDTRLSLPDRDRVRDEAGT